MCLGQENILADVEGAMGQKGMQSSCFCDSECIVKRGEKQASGRISTGSFSAMWSMFAILSMTSSDIVEIKLQ